MAQSWLITVRHGRIENLIDDIVNELFNQLILNIRKNAVAWEVAICGKCLLFIWSIYFIVWLLSHSNGHRQSSFGGKSIFLHGHRRKLISNDFTFDFDIGILVYKTQFRVTRKNVF